MAQLRLNGELLPPVPDALYDVERVRTLPAILAGLLAFLGLATLVHSLVSLVRSHRRDLALLKTLGFTRPQVAATTAWQGTAFVAAALVCGLPLGVAAGRWAWRLVADQLGVESAPRVPVLAILLIVPAALLVANLAAAVPGWLAARARSRGVAGRVATGRGGLAQPGRMLAGVGGVMRRAFVGGRVETMDDGPMPSVVIVADGRIEAVGDHGLLDGPGHVETVDLRGRLLLPGFVDAHHHLSIAAPRAGVGGPDRCGRPGACRRAAGGRGGPTPGATWVRGCNWSRDALRLTLQDLDAMGFDRPAIVACTSLHRCVVSSRGLDELGIAPRRRILPAGGSIGIAPAG